MLMANPKVCLPSLAGTFSLVAGAVASVVACPTERYYLRGPNFPPPELLPIAGAVAGCCTEQSCVEALKPSWVTKSPFQFCPGVVLVAVHLLES